MKITSSITINTVITDDIDVAAATLELRGISTGKISLSDSSTLELFGTHNGDIYVDESCIANIHGILNGNISNYGQVNIWGIVTSKKLIGHSIHAHKNAVINATTIQSDELYSY